MSEKKVVGYVRVSTEMQARDGLSLDQQRGKIKAYCAAMDLTLIDICADEGLSAKDLDRPGLQRALSMLQGKEVEGVVVTKLDRLTRSVRDLCYLATEVFGAGRGELIAITDSVDTRTAAGRMHLNMLGAVSQWERETIGERVRDCHHATAAREGGWWYGQEPYGWKSGPPDERGRRKPIPNEEEQKVISMIRAWAAGGKSQQEICDLLNAEGIGAKRGGKWHRRCLVALLRREGIRTKRSTNNPAGRPKQPHPPKTRHARPLSPWPDQYRSPLTVA